MVVTDMGMKQGFKAQTRAQIQGDFIDNCTMYPLSLTPTSHSPPESEKMHWQGMEPNG
jgi:hypothetical protein